MATYTGNMDLWKKAIDKAVKEIPLHKLGIGLQTINPNTGKPLTDEELNFRFQWIHYYKIQEIDIWKSPLKENWIPFLKKYAEANY